jgi:tRNA(adenine34) deaminase
MHDDRYWMRLALGEASAAFDKGEVPVGCLVVHDDEVIAKAHNRVEESGDPLAHAEIIALGEAAKSRGRELLADCVVYVTIEPCVMCIGAMSIARIPKLVYGAGEPRTGACGGRLGLAFDAAFEPRIAIIGGVEREECARLMKLFFKGKR